MGDSADPEAGRSNPVLTGPLSVLLGIIVANLSLQPLTEPDFGWHLRMGVDLLRQGGVLPARDPYSHTMPDWAWVEHAWLTDLTIGMLYQTAGGLGVILFFALVTSAAWVIACTTTSVAGPVARLIACSLSLWVALPFLGARTQVISLLGLAVLSLIMHRWRRGEKRILWWLPPLFLLWANLHGGFTAGLVWLGICWLGTAILRAMLDLRPGLTTWIHEPVPSRSGRTTLLLVVGLCALVTLANPYGYRLYGEIIDSLSDQFMLETLQEWQPPSLATLAGRGFLFYLVGLGVGLSIWYRRIEPIQWAIWSLFLCFALRHLRNIPLFLIVSLPLFADLLSVAFADLVHRLGLRALAMKRGALVMACALAAYVLWLGPDHLRGVCWSGVEPAAYFRSTSYPIEAIEWVQSHRQAVGQKLYNDYGDGGFLLWWLPGEKIFIDGRMPTWRAGDRRIFYDYVMLNSFSSPALSILDRYGVDWALVRKASPMDQVFGRELNWLRVYEDRKASVYVRRPAKL